LEIYAHHSRYDLTDTPFADGAKALQEFDDEFQQKAEGVFARELPNKREVKVSNGGMNTIFAYALENRAGIQSAGPEIASGVEICFERVRVFPFPSPQSMCP